MGDNCKQCQFILEVSGNYIVFGSVMLNLFKRSFANHFPQFQKQSIDEGGDTIALYAGLVIQVKIDSV